MSEIQENQLQYTINSVFKENVDLKKRLALIEANYEELLGKEIQFHSLIEKLSEGFVINDVLGNCVYANRFFCDILGYENSEIVNKPAKFFLHSSSYYNYERELFYLKQGKTRKFELDWKKSNDETVTTSVSISPLFDNDGNYKGNYAVISDITKRKLAQQALLENEEKYRNLVERAHDGIGIIQDGVFKYVNNQFALISEFTIDEMLEMPLIDIFTKEHKDKVKNFYVQHLKGEQTDIIYQAEILSKSKIVKHVEINGGLIHYKGQNADLIIIRDISDRKKINAELVESRKKYKVLEENIPLGIYRSTPGGRLISGNTAMLNLFHFKSQKEFIKSEVLELYADKKQRNKFIEQLNRDGTIEGYEIELKRRDNSTFWASISTTTVYDENGRPVYYDGIIRDISEKKQAEIDICESEEKFRTISEQSIMAIVIMQDGIIKYMNSAFCNLFGYTREEILEWGPHRYIKVIHKDSVQDVLERGRKLVLGPEYVGRRFTFKGRTKKGEIRYVDNYSKIIKYQGRRALLMSLIDITDRKLMEAEVQRAQKLESTGLLAGGIAHDFNNRLSVILGNAQLARLYKNNEKKLEKFLMNIESSAAQATSLTQQLLTFSKGGAPIKVVCSVKDLIQDAINLSMSGSNVYCATQFDNDLYNINVDKGQITQVLNNILINAEQAMPNGGKIYITAKNELSLKTEHISKTNCCYVLITIQDQGTGIPENIVDKIFDPYFTTKQKGSGLGLAVAYSIVEKHNGILKVESTLGKGTTFLLYLPATRVQIALEKKMILKTSVGTGNILVMDDEELVLDMVGDILIEAGYNVVLAKDGDETIDLYKKALDDNNPFQAVIMDLTIPGGLGGKETIVELKKIDPNVKAIVSSGYSNDPIMADYVNFGFVGVIAKPYKIKELQESLTEILK